MFKKISAAKIPLFVLLLLLIAAFISLSRLGNIRQYFTAATIPYYELTKTQTTMPFFAHVIIANGASANVKNLSFGVYSIYDSSIPATGVTFRFLLDGKPMSPILTYPGNFTWDTSTVPMGSHILSVQIVDGTDIYLLRPTDTEITIGSVPFTTPQLIASTVKKAYYLHYGHAETVLTSARGELVPFTGAPVRNKAVPLPYTFDQPAWQRGAAAIALLGSGSTNYLRPEGLVSTLVDYTIEFPTFQKNSSNQAVSKYALFKAAAVSEPSAPTVKDSIAYDGGRNDNTVNPYSTYIPNPSGTGWIGVDIGGRLFRIDGDGTVTTIAGRRTNRMTLPGPSARNELVGTFQNNLEFNMPVDVVANPLDPKVFFVADTGNNRIAKVDTNVNPVQITTFAGIPWVMGTAAPQGGYIDGTKAAAVFNRPYSIVAQADGTLLVADMGNNSIRKISPLGIVSTVFGPQTAFNNPALTFPQTIRLDSKDNLIVGTEKGHGIWRLDFVQKTATNIYTIGADGWIWIDVDRYGNLGPKDDILVAIAINDGGAPAFATAGNKTAMGHNINLFRISADGKRRMYPVVTDYVHYPWAIAIDDNEAKMVASGFDVASGITQFTPPRPTSPVYGTYEDKLVYTVKGKMYQNGLFIHRWGSVPGDASYPHTKPDPFFPRAPLSTTLSYNGLGFTGAKTFDEIAAMTDAEIATYVQSGMGGSTPRPEITGNDLRDYIYLIKRQSLVGTTTVVQPGPSATDTAVPVVSNVSITQTGPHSAQVTWSTNEPTIGAVRSGIKSGQYHGWSTLETGYATTHVVTFDGLAANKLNFFQIRSKDLAGNKTFGAELSMAMGTVIETPSSSSLSSSSISVNPNAVISAVKSGNWTDPQTWELQTIPTSDKDVEIPSGITVIYDKPYDSLTAAEAKEVIVKAGGTLRFSRALSTRLDLDGSLSVLSGGTLDVGTALSPIPSAITAHIGFNVPNDKAFSGSDSTSPTFQVGRNPSLPSWHPEDIGLFVIGTNARATFHGAPKYKIWTKISASAVAGATQITLVDVPQGWRVGDTILVTSSSKNSGEQEKRTIKAIQGNTITLSSGLSYAHQISSYAYNTVTKQSRAMTTDILLPGEVLVTVRPEVALLTQNVVVASNMVTESSPHHRSHTMMAHGGVASFSYTELRDLGPRAKFGRYPMHVHMVGSLGSQVLIQGVSIWSSISDPTNKWIAIHGSQGVTIKDTVGFNAQGRGFMMEDAIEYGNTIQDTLGVLVHSPEELLYAVDTGFPELRTAAAVFWIREGNTYRGNVAVGGSDAAGFWITPNLNASAPKSTVFEQNEAHGNTQGLFYSDAAKLTVSAVSPSLWRNAVGLQTGVHASTYAKVKDGIFIENTSHYSMPSAEVTNGILIPSPPSTTTITSSSSHARDTGVGSSSLRNAANNNNVAPVVSAGSDKTVSLPTNGQTVTITLQGTVSDDGLPLGHRLSTTWAMTTGPANMTITSPNSLQTTATFFKAGTYYLVLRATDGQALTVSHPMKVVIMDVQGTPLSSSSSAPTTVSSSTFRSSVGVHSSKAATVVNPNNGATVSSVPGNYTPVVSAGANQTITFPSNGQPATATLKATVSGYPSTVQTYVQWTVSRGGPANPTFTSNKELQTTVTFPMPGTYPIFIGVYDYSTKIWTNSPIVNITVLAAQH